MEGKTLDHSKKDNLINKKLRNLLAMFQDANENGLFTSENDNTCNDIYNKIVEGLDECAREDMVDRKAHDAFFSAFRRFNDSIACRGFWWRFTYCYGGPILLYFCAILITITCTWLFFQDSLIRASLLWVPAWAYIWGAVGGVLQGFWFLWQKISARRLRKYWFVWFLSLPLIGALLGVLVYFVYYTGFIISTGATTLLSESFGMLLSALAGFCSLWAINTLNALTDIIHIRGFQKDDE